MLFKRISTGCSQKVQKKVDGVGGRTLVDKIDTIYFTENSSKIMKGFTEKGRATVPSDHPLIHPWFVMCVVCCVLCRRRGKGGEGRVEFVPNIPVDTDVH